MVTRSQQLVQKLWSHCNALRDDGLSCGDCAVQELIAAKIERRLSVVKKLSTTVKRNL